MTVQEWLGEDNQLGIDIWEKKYQRNGENFEDWLDRVSGGNQEIRELIKQKKFLFGGRILANRGAQKDGERVVYSNCFVLTPPDDNLESIFECAKKMARTFSCGGGVGIDIGKLAPRGAKLNNAAKETTGAVSFMDLYSLITGLISQHGRRGALMISIPCDHPDVEEFIECKSDLNRITKANISIRISDDFMKAVENDEDWYMSYVREETGENIYKKVKAKDLYHKFCEMNWDYAEPGMLFWDRISNWNLMSEDEDFEYAGVNPCAEESLPSGGSCMLCSINLSEFIKDNKVFDFENFQKTVDIAIKGINEVMEEGLPLLPLEEQRKASEELKQVGLGIFGLGDMLIKMGIRYGSLESIELCDKIGFLLARQAINTSEDLGYEKGNFPRINLDAINNSDFYKLHFNRPLLHLRNSQLLTCAPTGTLSSMLGVSGGIEPIFANYYTRKTESLHGHDEYYKVYTPIVKKYMDDHGLDDDTKLPDFFVTAHDLDYRQRIDMQSTWQKHIDASISSTINVPNNFTVEQVEDLYMYAWKQGLKGVTIYRDGCKRSGILTTNDSKEEEVKTHELKRGMIIVADSNCIGKKRKLNTGCGSLHLLAYFDPDNGDLLECFLSKGSTGGCANSLTGLSRMISLSARGGIDIYSIVDQLKSCGSCPAYAVRSATKHDTSKGSSCPVAVGNALLEMYKELQVDLEYEPDTKEKAVTIQIKTEDDVNRKTVKCPECGGELTFQGGCVTCQDCGWSKCE